MLYVVYMYQKSLNFTYAFKCYQQKCQWLHFSWATLYIYAPSWNGLNWNVQSYRVVSNASKTRSTSKTRIYTDRLDF